MPPPIRHRGRLQSKAIIYGSTEYILIHNGIIKDGDFTEELLFENYIHGNSKYILKGYRRFLTLYKLDLVKLTIHNQLGIPIEVLLEEHRNAGSHAITFASTNLPSGFSFINLKHKARQ